MIQRCKECRAACGEVLCQECYEAILADFAAQDAAQSEIDAEAARVTLGRLFDAADVEAARNEMLGLWGGEPLF